MKLILRVSLIVLALGIVGVPLTAQQTDFEVWLKAGIKYKLNDRWSFDLEEQIRFDDDANALKNYHSELGIKFELNKFLDLLLTTRYITRNDNRGNRQGFEDHFRYQLGLSAKHDMDRFELKHRLLYQHRNEVGLSEADGDISRRFFRWRSGATYKIKNWKYDPQFNAEYFLGLNKDAAGIENSIRFTFGTERKYKKVGEFGIFYRYETTLGTPIDEITHVLALKYTYTIG
ncbi:MAG: DUF2490 domain-containing protein [Roseivirga sp.]|nr:DUF2490 domain-containing protein [Roseivirga sp.]